MKLNRKTMKWMLIGLCFVVFATWIVLLVEVFGSKPKKALPIGEEMTTTPSVSATPASPTVTPTPDGMVEVFLLEREYRFVDGERTVPHLPV